MRAIAPAPPAGWIGDGVTSTTFTGSPLPTPYNKIRLEAPAGTDLDGRGNSFIESPNLVISGHIPASATVPLALTVDRVTCSHIGAAESIDVWVTTQQGAIVQVQDATSLAILFTGTVTDPSGKFYASFFPPAPAPDAVIVSVTTLSPGFTPSSKTANVVDYVNITAANYSLAGKTITISATSSDWFKHPTTPPTLTAVGFGTLTFIEIWLSIGYS